MDENYLIGRMDASLAMARGAKDSAVRLIHFEFAGRYGLAAAGFPSGQGGIKRLFPGRAASSFHASAAARG